LSRRKTYGNPTEVIDGIDKVPTANYIETVEMEEEVPEQNNTKPSLFQDFKFSAQPLTM